MSPHEGCPLCVTVWGQAVLAATLCWMSCWTWLSVKAWWISTTASKPSALDGSTWSRQRSGQPHAAHHIQKKSNISYLSSAYSEGYITNHNMVASLSSGIIQENQVFKHLFFPPVVCINILPLWDLCKGHYNSLREKTRSVVHRHMLFFIREDDLHMQPLLCKCNIDLPVYYNCSYLQECSIECTLHKCLPSYNSLFSNSFDTPSRL